MGGSVLVAGGTGALGSAVVAALIDADFAVVATWVDERERERTAAQFADRRLSLVRADLMDAPAVATVVEEVPDLSAVVNLVGGYAASGKVHETDPEEFNRMLALNLRPGFLLARAAIPRLVARGGGAFVAVSARPALQPFAGAAGYITAKAAVIAFVRALDAEYRDAGVRCNAIAPGVIDTPANRRNQPDAHPSTWTAPADIAAVIRFLVSEDSTVVTGATIPVYGRS
jgi:NAD(P)-dependent dehydrogenase (short-subunit alcohol dehydrogenase family)